jgi:hypothetical protein
VVKKTKKIFVLIKESRSYSFENPPGWLKTKKYIHVNKKKTDLTVLRIPRLDHR